MKLASFFLLVLGSCLSLSGRADVIYGEDNRKEIFEASTRYQELARSVVSMIPKKKIKTINDIITLDQTRFGSGRSGSSAFCPSVRFTDQPSVAQCSGVLIAPDVILTAGHCLLETGDCGEASWIFDYALYDSTSTTVSQVASDNVYQCRRVISQVLSSSLGLDYGIVQLDRKVKGRSPISYRSAGNLNAGEEVFVIGNPNGLPLKIADEAFVRDQGTNFNFTANLDTFTGNSGSPVFNPTSGQLEGILVSGEDDFRLNSQDLCTEVKKCANEGCRGEGVTRVLAIPEVSLRNNLMKSAERGDIPQLRKILNLKTWIDFPDEMGRTALYLAVASYQVEAAKILFAAGADPSAQDSNGLSVRQLAQENNPVDFGFLLLAK